MNNIAHINEIVAANPELQTTIAELLGSRSIDISEPGVDPRLGRYPNFLAAGVEVPQGQTHSALMQIRLMPTGTGENDFQPWSTLQQHPAYRAEEWVEIRPGTMATYKEIPTSSQALVEVRGRTGIGGAEEHAFEVHAEELPYLINPSSPSPLAQRGEREQQFLGFTGALVDAGAIG